MKITVKEKSPKTGQITSKITYKSANVHTSPAENIENMKKSKTVPRGVPPHDSPQMWGDGDWQHRRTVDTGEIGHH